MLTSTFPLTGLCCSFGGTASRVADFCFMEGFMALGIHRVTLCDTTGMAHPAQVERFFRGVAERFPHASLAAHFHNTRAMGLANALAALEAGIDRFDASLGGLGGCPFAPGASGNVCTEDLVHMFASMGYDTRVNLEALVNIAEGLAGIVGHELPGMVIKAGPLTRRYPMPQT